MADLPRKQDLDDSCARNSCYKYTGYTTAAKERAENADGFDEKVVFIIYVLNNIVF